MTGRLALPDDMRDRVLLAWVDRVLSLGPSGFVPTGGLEEMLRGALRASESAFGHVLLPEADPFRGTGTLAVTAHAAGDGSEPDLLRYELETARLAVRITDGINFTLVRAAFRDHALDAASDRARYARALLDAVVLLDAGDHQWDVALAGGFGEDGGPQHAANRGAPPVRDVASRHDRMDVLAFDGAIHFVFYKKVEQLELWQNDAAWFSADARAAILRRMNATAPEA